MRQIREVIGIRLVKHSIGKSEYVNWMDGNYILDKTVSEVQNVNIRILIRKKHICKLHRIQSRKTHGTSVKKSREKNEYRGINEIFIEA